MTTILAATLPRILLQGPSWYVRTPQSIGLNGLKRPLVEGSGHKVELVISSVESPDGWGCLLNQIRQWWTVPGFLHKSVLGFRVQRSLAGMWQVEN